MNASFRVVANNMKYGNCKVQGGFNIQRRNQDENSVGFDSRDDQRNKNNYTSMSTTVKTAVSISKETVIAT
ncbi:MAG: hypothetical protein ACLRS8_04380 [Parabacteroides merdae]